MLRNTKHIWDRLISQFGENVQAYLPSSKIKGENYDKFRDTGYTESKQNYKVVKAYIKDISPEAFIARGMGLVEVSGKQVIIHQKDLSLIKTAQKLVIRNNDYYLWEDTIGKKFQITELAFNYHKIFVFRKHV